ncbi:MAG TPA: VCBS repeat-containing protein, partial [Candidatus Polarisedimenticolia bacterium]|nr:VCBS repeat-containing protein [Candidatus Polarisedimenticolia bacterium]
MKLPRRLPGRLALLLTFATFAAGRTPAVAAPPTFAAKRLVNTIVNGLLPFDVRTGDIDQDGDLDIYTANYSGRISWFENDGAHPPGPWTEHILTEFADGVEATVAVRVDPDSDIDFFSAAFNRDEIAWYDNGGSGTTWTLKPITFNVPLAVDVWAADLDGDGDNDAISASGSDGRVAWFENAGGFDNFWTMRVVPGATAGSVEAADVDQDGDLDIVAGASWCESDGAAPPAFTTHLFNSTPVFADAIAVVDADRDGDPDVLTAGQEDDRITWYENDGGLPVGWTR